MKTYSNQLDNKSVTGFMPSDSKQAIDPLLQKTARLMVTIACLSFFPITYFVGRWAMQYFA